MGGGPEIALRSPWTTPLGAVRHPGYSYLPVAPCPARQLGFFGGGGGIRSGLPALRGAFLRMPLVLARAGLLLTGL